MSAQAALVDGLKIHFDTRGRQNAMMNSAITPSLPAKSGMKQVALTHRLYLKIYGVIVTYKLALQSAPS